MTSATANSTLGGSCIDPWAIRYPARGDLQRGGARAPPPLPGRPARRRPAGANDMELQGSDNVEKHPVVEELESFLRGTRPACAHRALK